MDRGFLELRRPWGFSPDARRGSQGASLAAPGKSGLHARGEGERKRHLLLGRKAMINLDSILKSRDNTLPTKVCIVKAMVFFSGHEIGRAHV